MVLLYCWLHQSFCSNVMTVEGLKRAVMKRIRRWIQGFDASPLEPAFASSDNMCSYSVLVCFYIYVCIAVHRKCIRVAPLWLFHHFSAVALNLLHHAAVLRKRVVPWTSGRCVCERESVAKAYENTCTCVINNSIYISSEYFLQCIFIYFTRTLL